MRFLILYLTLIVRSLGNGGSDGSNDNENNGDSGSDNEESGSGTDNSDVVSGNAVTVTKLTSDDSSTNEVYQNLFTIATEQLKLQDEASIKDAFLSSCDWIIDYMEYAGTPSDMVNGYNQKQGNCYAYCQIQEALCKMLNIRCHTYLGDGTQGQHTWNRVKIDGSWYFSDMVYYDQILAQNSQYLAYAQQLRMWTDPAASYSSIPNHGDSISRLTNGVVGENLGSYTEIDWDTIDENSID